MQIKKQALRIPAPGGFGLRATMVCTSAFALHDPTVETN